MKFNHLSFPSNDVAATTAFFVDQLGCMAERHGAFTALKRAGFDIIIEDARERAVAWPHNFHLGFELSAVEDVRALHRQFKEAGVTMTTDVFHHERGSRFFARRRAACCLKLTPGPTRKSASVPASSAKDSPTR